MERTAVSLFSGAGGMDLGFERAGFRTVWACDSDPAACETHRRNIGAPVECGRLGEIEIPEFGDVDCVHGGPPCQGFSIAGKMDAADPRSGMVSVFMDCVERIRPRSFVMENVKALASLAKFRGVLESLLERAARLGYATDLGVMNAALHGTPQARERMFIVGILGDGPVDFVQRMQARETNPTTALDAIRHLGPEGSEGNPRTCNAGITVARNPLLRRTPYGGMIFNGGGRLMRPDTPSSTLVASMGGSHTPIVDDRLFYGDGESWSEGYHARLMAGGTSEGEIVPDCMRRLTIAEARIIGGFPADWDPAGGNSAVYRQIGNSVPPPLAEAVAATVLDILDNPRPRNSDLPLFDGPE